MKPAKAFVVVLLGAIFVTGAACGGGGKDKAAAKADAPSKADYLAQARAVCQQGNATLSKASDEVFAKVPPGQKLSPPEIEAFVRTTVVPTLRDQIKQLRAIKPPDGEQQHVDEIYGALEKGLDELEQAPAKLTDGSNVFGAADALAQKYGISVCAGTP